MHNRRYHTRNYFFTIQRCGDARSSPKILILRYSSRDRGSPVMGDEDQGYQPERGKAGKWKGEKDSFVAVFTTNSFLFCFSSSFLFPVAPVSRCPCFPLSPFPLFPLSLSSEPICQRCRNWLFLVEHSIPSIGDTC